MNTYLTVAKINYHRIRAITEMRCGTMAEFYCQLYQTHLRDLLTMLELR